MCALSLPVRRHWAMNCVCERFMIAAVVNIEIGTLTNAIRASSGEIQNIIPSTAITVSSEVSSWLIVCCNVWLMLSMSLVTRERSSPRGWVSKYSSGSSLTLVSTSERMSRTVPWTTSLSRNPWTNESTEAAAYSPSTTSSTDETALKSTRSEERREGHEWVSTCRTRWSPYHK